VGEVGYVCVRVSGPCGLVAGCARCLLWVSKWVPVNVHVIRCCWDSHMMWDKWGMGQVECVRVRVRPWCSFRVPKLPLPLLSRAFDVCPPPPSFMHPLLSGWLRGGDERWQRHRCPEATTGARVPRVP
jgi:hypothetical protein